MPHRLNWAVYVCNECKEVFKRLQMLKRHQEKTGHTGMLEYTVSCNFGMTKIIVPIQDRCMPFELKPLKKDDIIKRLIFIRDNEKVKIELSEIERIAKESGGSMRKAITELEKVSMSDNEEEAILRRYLKK